MLPSSDPANIITNYSILITYKVNLFCYCIFTNTFMYYLLYFILYTFLNMLYYCNCPFRRTFNSLVLNLIDLIYCCICKTT